MTDDNLLKLISNDDEDIESELHGHFDEKNDWYWCEIGAEGRRLAGLAFGTEIDMNSNLGAIISAVAAQASSGVEAAIACALGIDPDIINIALSEWVEKCRTDSVGFKGFLKIIEDEKKQKNKLDKSMKYA